MKFAITMPTYNKANKVFPLVKKAIESVLAQTYTDWKLYLIGDKYEPDSEFRELAKLVPADKLYVDNLSVAVERDTMVGMDLWHNGGMNATNFALNKQRADKIPVTTRLDHDDIWLPHHLQTLADHYANFPEAVFVYTQAKWLQTKMPEHVPLCYNNLLPTPCNMVHSSASWKLDAIPLNYEFATGPCDAHMWLRISRFCRRNCLKTLYVPLLTVLHPTERE